MEITTTSQPRRVEELGNGVLEIFDLPTAVEFLNRLLEDIFTNHWDKIVFGTLIQGSVFEIKAPNAPKKIGYLDGYLTVDFGVWHLHICTGENKGTSKRPTPPELAQIRRTSRAELYRRLNPDDTVGGWGLRLFNGRDENQLTVFLPNPFLSDDMKFLKEPDWSRLALWDYLRATYLGLAPDSRDRSGKTMFHG
ncbi:MAG: hypothetical protein NZ553_08550 [Caldilinea sp.]|nr:hypothetical protein [Caldilinea sp.]MDW8440506.1 hypothetical protein [Caldilineaceae bacterium]